MRGTAILGISILPIEASIYSYYVQVPTLPALPILIATISLLAFSTNIYFYRHNIAISLGIQSASWNGLRAAVEYVESGCLGSGFNCRNCRRSFRVVCIFPVAALAAGVGGMFYTVQLDRIEKTVIEREKKELELELELEA